MGYFWEDDDELNPKQRAMQSVLESDFVPQTPAAYSPMTRAPAQSFMGGMGSTPILPAINLARNMARPTSLDSPPSGGYSPAPVAAPGANALGGIMGMAAGMQAGDRPYLQNGPVPPEQQPVGRVWTEADLEPLSVGSFGGFNFAKAARPYFQESANLPIFRADMAQRAQALNFAAEMANSQRRMDFQGMENEADRQNRLAIAMMANDSKKDQDLALAGDQRLPQEIRDQKIRDMVGSGRLTPKEAASFKLAQTIEQAAKVGKPDSKEYWNYITSNFDPATMDKGELIEKLKRAGVDPNAIWGNVMTDVPFWKRAMMTPANRDAEIDNWMMTQAPPDVRRRYEISKSIFR